MSRKRRNAALVGLFASVLVIAGCGGTDPTPAADKLSEQYTSDLQRGLDEAGATPAQAEGAEITVACPDSVNEGESFDCTVSGTPGGESLDIEMQVDGDTIDVVNEAEAQATVDEVFLSVAEAVAG